MTFNAPSYYIEVLGDKYADLEMPNFLERFGDSR
jgi:hypothetical protein